MSRRYALVVVLALASCAGLAGAAEPLAFYDIRFEGDAPAVPVRQAIAASRAGGQGAGRRLALQALAQRIAGVRISDHETLGTPHFVRSTRRWLTGPVEFGAPVPVSVVKDFVAEHQALFEIDPAELDGARLERHFITRHNGVTHLTLGQQIGGIPLFGAALRTNVTARGELINVSSTMLRRPAEGFGVPQVVLEPLAALGAAAANIGTVITIDPVPLGPPQDVQQLQTWSVTPDFRADVPITTELVYFPLTRTNIRPAWSVVLPELGIGNTYEILVDAVDGTVLRRWNRLQFGGTEPITLRVYTSDSPAPGSPGTNTPDGFQFPFVPRDLLEVAPAEVAPFSPNGWIDDGINETVGNNVLAHLDRNSDNEPDLPRPQGNPYRVFDFPLDLALAPETYSDAAVVQLFYLCNVYHDRLYALGFDEAAGNFQQNNFGLGGLGNDPLLADTQDGGGIPPNVNNANFSTPPDGQSGRMQMFIFTGPNPDRDSALDADIVFHEFSHGLSNRLHGTLAGTQPQSMGEGWGDFFGISLNAEPDDDPHAVYAVGGYITFRLFSSGYVNNYYFGIRRFPYSTDPTKNPQTYADIDPAQQSYPPTGEVPRNTSISNTADEVHNAGEVWCMALMECRANLWDLYGFAGNELMMQLVVDGMKLSPTSPNFLQARDAILQADLLNNGGVNLLPLWRAFAKRGLGESASSPGTSASGVVEAFDVPALIFFDYPGGIPAQVLPGEPTPMDVNLVLLGAEVPLPGSGQLHVSVNEGPFTATAMIETAPNEYEATLPASNCLDRLEFYVSVATSNGIETDPPDAPATVFSAVVATGATIVLADDFQTDQGWTATNLGADSGDWQRGVPVNDPDWPFAPTSDSDGSGACYLTENATGNSDVDNGAVRLLSPVMDMSAGGNIISYDYFLRLTETDGSDRLVVEINSFDGNGMWTEIALHDADGALTWRNHLIDSASLDAAGVVLTPTMRLRFTVNDAAAQSIVEAGLDAVDVSRYVCEVITCSVAAQCDDGNPCTDDACTNGTCVQAFNTAACDDGDACTTNDTCSNGSCAGGPPPDCVDADPCTTDSCDPEQGCLNVPLDCADANPCTDDACVAGACTHTDNTVPCGDACTTNGVCSAGTCVGTTVDCSDTDPCTVDTCDPITGCLNTPLDCDDGLFCTGVETCLNGTCTSNGTPCPPGLTCDDILDACVGCVINADCDDGDPCDGAETCDEFGVCQSDPCFAEVVVLQQSFDLSAAPGTGTFLYQDDTFRGTANPDFADGSYEPSGGLSGGAVRVVLGTNSTDMSGGWVSDFTIVGTPVAVEVAVAFRLWMAGDYESDEFGEALLAIDGVLHGVPPNDYLARLVGDGNSPSDPMDTGWLTHTFTLSLAAGTHGIAVGGYNNKSTVTSEFTEVFFDDITITAFYDFGCTCDDSLFCNGTEACVDGQCVGSGSPCPVDRWCREADDACLRFGNGDFDGDNDRDLGDFAAFQECFGQPAGPGCEPGNLTGDEVIDLDDYALFHAALTGPQ